MSSLRNALEMIFILRKGTVVKVKDLAGKLEVSEKQIRRYKEQLDEFFYIESIPGPNGGYELKDDYFPFREFLTEKEIDELKLALMSLDNSIMDGNISLEKAIDKINFSILNKDELNYSEQLIPYSKVKNTGKAIMKLREDIHEAIIREKEILIEYVNNNGEESKRQVQPYQCFTYRGESYLIANCLKKNGIRYFKLARVKRYIVTEKHFKKDINVNRLIEDHKNNSIGIFGGEEFKLVLEINPPIANTIKERIWVDNQEVEEIGQGKIIFKATMKGKPEIISWLLMMGDSVKVIEPKSIKDELRIKLNNMIRNLE